MTASNHGSIHAIVPLALLEAIRNLDTPLDDGLAELPTETVARRLGMSTTVAAQIDRYREAADRNGTVVADEAVQVFRLVGRRTDASLVYADAGRRAARMAARGAPSLARWLPRSLQQSLGESRAARVSLRVFGLNVARGSQGVGLRLTSSLASIAGCAGPGCQFYGALLSELLRVTSGFEGGMVHDQCLARGDAACAWQAAEALDW